MMHFKRVTGSLPILTLLVLLVALLVAGTGQSTFAQMMIRGMDRPAAVHSSMDPATISVNATTISGYATKSGRGTTATGTPQPGTGGTDLQYNAPSQSSKLAAFFPSDLSQPMVVEGNGLKITMKPVGVAPIWGEVEDGKMVYTGKTGYCRSVTGDRVVDAVTLSTLDPGMTIDYEILSIDGPAKVSLRDGAVLFTDSTGTGLQLEAPLVMDGTGQYLSGAASWKMKESNHKQFLSLVVNDSIGASPLTITRVWTLRGADVQSSKSDTSAIIASPIAGTGITDPSLIASQSTYDFSADADGSTPTVFPGGTIAGGGIVRTIGSGWVTWNPQTAGLHVVQVANLTVNFTSPVQMVALKAEPNPFAVVPITIQAFDGGANLIATYTRGISGQAGADFLGILSNQFNIASIRVFAAYSDFAFSNLTWGSGYDNCISDINGTSLMLWNSPSARMLSVRCVDNFRVYGFGATALPAPPCFTAVTINLQAGGWFLAKYSTCPWYSGTSVANVPQYGVNLVTQSVGVARACSCK